MNVYSFDPLGDPRWAPFVEQAAQSSVFHSPGWLNALQRTYGFSPSAFTTSAPGQQLTNAVVFAEVRSRLTGHRLVSLPFSDHCEPLVDDAAAFDAIGHAVLQHGAQHGLRFVEMRPASTTPAPSGFATSQTYWLHRLDLRPEPGVLFRALHKDSIQRKVRRAEREGLTYRAGRDEALVRDLRHLLDLTRRRHRAPLQPLMWFRNLVASMGDRLTIRIAYHRQTPAAGILTMTHGRAVVYKYGGSDTRLHALGGMPFLFWHAIREARESGAENFDLGRSDRDNVGLVTFKDRWSARRSVLTYWRGPGGHGRTNGWETALARSVLARLPGPLRRAVGGVLYPHIG